MEENPKIYGLIVGDGPDKEKFLNLPLKNSEKFIYTGFLKMNYRAIMQQVIFSLRLH